MPVHADGDDASLLRAYSFELKTPGKGASSMRELVEANSKALHRAAPRGDGNAEERATDPFAADDTADDSSGNVPG